MQKNKLDIIFENDDYVAVNKPTGWLSIPDRHDPTLLNVTAWLRQQYGQIFIVHRIDRDTSGAILFAKNEASHRHASMAFGGRTVTKKYWGIVHGTPMDEQGSIHDRLMEHPVIKGKMIVHAKLGKEAITNYRVVESFKGFTVMEFHILTGRMHQIRVHSANMGTPLLCDPIYGTNTPILVSQLKRKFNLGKYVEEEQPILNRLALHAHSVQFNDEQGNEIKFEAPLFKDMRATIAQMEKWLK